MAGGPFGGRDLELHGAPRVVLIADLDVASEGRCVANLLKSGRPEGESLPAVSQRGTQPRADLIAGQARCGVEIFRGARPESEQQLDCHASLDQEHGLVVLIARVAHKHGSEGDVSELPACALLKLRVRDDVTQSLLKRAAVPGRSVIASIAHCSLPDDARRGRPVRERRQRG